MFLDTFKGDSRASELSKISLEVFQGSLRQFQRCFREVSRAFKERVKCVSIKFQGCLKNVLMKLCFVILLLHVSHRSYPSRRRACSNLGETLMLKS